MIYTGTVIFTVDDPLDTVAIHLGGGFWGLISASIFSNSGLVFGITRKSLMVRSASFVLEL
jgi:Amt family ammonium transporter